MSDSNVNCNLSCVGAKKSVQSLLRNISRCCVVKKQMSSKVPWRKPLLSWRLTVSSQDRFMCISMTYLQLNVLAPVVAPFPYVVSWVTSLTTFCLHLQDNGANLLASGAHQV